MKLLLKLILIISFISNCYSQSSSSSSSVASSESSEECAPNCSGPNCSVCVPYLSVYNAAGPQGGSVYFLGYFGEDTNGLSIKIGGQDCGITWIAGKSRVDCYIGPLNLYEFYDVEVSNANGVIILQEDFYSPFIQDCGLGYFYMGHCVCIENYQGTFCNEEMPPYITSITSCSIDGGVVTGKGWFGSSGSNLSFFIGNKKVRISYIDQTTFVGSAQSGTGSQDITIYNSLDNQLLFTGSNLFQYDSNKCFNDCFNNGQCNNGVCTCDYPWVGDFCSHAKDSSCQCTY